MLLPTNIATGRVTGQFLAGVVDGVDDDQDPDAVPAAGFVTFTASVPYLPDPTAAPNPATILTTSVVAVLDNEGYLCTPAQGTLEPSYRGVRLIATDDPDLSVEGWTWNATYSFSTVAGQKLAIPTHSFAVPSDGVVDLTTVVKVPSSAGIGTEQAEALAASAQAAAIQSAQDAATAAQAAVDAAAAAQVTDTGIAALVATPGSATALEVAGLVDESNAAKLDTDEAINTFQSQAALDSAAAAKVNTAGTATNSAVKSIADTSAAAAAGPKLDAATAATTYAAKSVETSKLDASQKGAVSGVAPLGTDSKVPDANLPTYVAPAALNAPASQPVSFEQFPFAAQGQIDANTAVIAQDTITTAPNGNSYAVYWDSNLEPRIAVKVNTAGAAWSTFNLMTATGSTINPIRSLDSHRNIVVAVDGDGYIHVSADHHNDKLRYIRSANPYDVTSWVSPGMTGADEDSVTYPQFVRLNSGDLLFFYRNGPGSGNGDGFINRYAKATKTWSRTIKLFVGTSPTVVPAQSAYTNRVAYDKANGRLHVFYMWRDDPNAETNHDFGYTYSDDEGVTWKTAAGNGRTTPILPSTTSGIIVTGYPAGLANQCGATVDSNGVQHGIIRTGNGGSQVLTHARWDGAAWVKTDVLTTDYVSRASLYATTTGKVYALYGRADYVYALRVYPTVGAEVQLYGYKQKGWQPCYDAYAPSNQLRLMLSAAVVGDPSYNSVYAGVLNVDMSKVDALPASTTTAAPTAPVKHDALTVPLAKATRRLEPTASVASTMDRRYIQNANITALTSGTLRLNAVWLPKNTVVSTIAFTAGASATNATNRWYALYDGAGNKLAVTADDATGFAAGITKVLALTAPYRTDKEGVYYLGICETADACTQLRGTTGNSSVFGIPPILAANGTAGLTTASTAPATTALTAVTWLAYGYTA